MRITSAARWIGGLAIAASLPLGAQVSSTAALGGGPGLGVAGTFEANLTPPPVGAFEFAAHGAFEERRLTDGMARGVGRLESSVSRRWGAGGATIGLGAERGMNADGARVQPLLSANLWRQLGRVVLSVGTEAHSAHITGRTGELHLRTIRDSAFNDTTGSWRHWIDTSTTADSGSASHALQWADVAARATWSGDRLTFDARIGVQPKLDVTPRTVWARATATIGLSPMLAFVAAAGTEPSRGWVGMPSSRFVSLGIRVAAAGLAADAPPPHATTRAPAFSAEELGGERYLLTLRLPDAHRVEISGDFTGWRPVAMRKTSSDMWQVTVPLARGSHRANVRIDDGTWIAPPGMSSTTDEFDGSVGIFFVR